MAPEEMLRKAAREFLKGTPPYPDQSRRAKWGRYAIDLTDCAVRAADQNRPEFLRRKYLEAGTAILKRMKAIKAKAEEENQT